MHPSGSPTAQGPSLTGLALAIVPARLAVCRDPVSPEKVPPEKAVPRALQGFPQGDCPGDPDFPPPLQMATPRTQGLPHCHRRKLRSYRKRGARTGVRRTC